MPFKSQDLIIIKFKKDSFLTNISFLLLCELFSMMENNTLLI